MVEIAALPENLKLIREVVKQTLVEQEVAKSVIDAVLLSVGEAAMNIIKHGFDGGDPNGRINLEMDSDQNELIFRLLDNAPSAEWREFRSRELDDIRPGGLGTYFMRELMDSVTFLPPPEGQGNFLEMRKRIKPK